MDEHRETNLLALLGLNLKLVLQHDHIPLSLLVLHLSLEGGAEGVEQVAARGDLLLREESNPLEASDEALLLGGRRELDNRLDLLNEGTVGRIVGSAPAASLGDHTTPYASEVSLAPMALAVTSFHLSPSAPLASDSTGLSLRNPSSTSVLMNAGKPW